VFLQKLIIHCGDGLLCVENGGEIEWNSDVNICRGGSVFPDVFKE
jgi:hypothetical protein